MPLFNALCDRSCFKRCNSKSCDETVDLLSENRFLNSTISLLFNGILSFGLLELTSPYSGSVPMNSSGLAAPDELCIRSTARFNAFGDLIPALAINPGFVGRGIPTSCIGSSLELSSKLYLLQVVVYVVLLLSFSPNQIV